MIYLNKTASKKYFFLNRGLLILIVILFLSQYIFFRYDFLTGYDTGVYVLELQKYIGASFYSGIQSFYQEVAALSLLSAWSFITAEVRPIEIYRFFMVFIATIQLFIVYIIFNRISKKPFLSLGLTIIFAFSCVSVNHFYLFIFRQFFTTTFVWIVVLIMLLPVEKHRKNLFLGYFLGIIFFFHKGTSLLVLPLIFIFIINNKDFKACIQTAVPIFILAGVIYLPYLTTFHDILFATIRDFFSMSADNAGGEYNQNTGVSFITGKVTAYKVNVMTKVFRENVFFGAALIFSLSCLRLIKRKSPLIHFILWGSVLLVLFLIDTNFSYRSTHIIFLIICFFIIATDIHKRILFILICAFLTTSIPFIIGRVPYLLYDSDPGVIQMLRNVKKENSIIIALGSDNNIPAQLGYTTLDYIATFDTEYRKNALMDKTFQKLPTKIFIYGHNTSLPLPSLFVNKSIYIVVGTYKKITFDYQTIDVLNSWEKSKLARKIFSEPKSKRIQAVYLYEPENLIQN